MPMPAPAGSFPEGWHGRASGGLKLESSSPPEWVNFILAEMNRRFDAQDAKLDKLVTQETFRDERQRVNDALRDMRADITQNTSDIKAEATARANAELTHANRERDEAQRRQSIEKQTGWQWLAVFVVPTVGLIITWVAGGGLAR